MFWNQKKEMYWSQKKITINDHQSAWQIKDDVQIGHYFVFVKPTQVLPVVEQPVELDGVTITPERHRIQPICCVVTDRDLYRAKQDLVHLFIAFPSPANTLHLVITYNKTFFAKLPVELTDSVGHQTLSHLMPGRYQAQLIADREVGEPVSFTVAEYNLAPLSARLISYQLKPKVEQLWFELAVESYQRPFTGELFVALVEADREIVSFGPLPHFQGHYTGGVNIPPNSQGPFRLRLKAADDAERVAEVTIPGSRLMERQVSMLSHLGPKKYFSMMPEANALPLRGGYLTEGESIDTPLIVEDIVTESGLIQVNANMESLTLVILDLLTGDYSVQSVGKVTAGDSVTAITNSRCCMVFIGGWVNGQAFEGYTTFIKPCPFQLSVEVPKTVRPREELTVRLTCEGLTEKTVPVLLCVRDERLTATEKPSVSLGAATKRGLDAATQGANQVVNLSQHPELLAYQKQLLAEKLAYQKQLRAEKWGIPLIDIEAIQLDPELIKLVDKKLLTKYRAIPIFKRGNRLFVAVSDPTNPVLREIGFHTKMHTEAILTDSSRLDKLIERDIEQVFDTSIGFDEDIAELEFEEEANEPYGSSVKYFKQKSLLTEQTRSEFPEVLFYDIVPVTGTQEVIIPLSDSLGTFAVETFALSEGDWTSTQTTVQVDKPVRIDLELPPTVYPQDKVIGRLHAVTDSPQAEISLTLNGRMANMLLAVRLFESHNSHLPKMVPLHEGSLRGGRKSLRGRRIYAFRMNTPVELEFYVQSGTYLAKVVDCSTGETDSIELVVGELGKFNSYAKELGLLRQQDSISLKTANAMSLRVLADMNTSFDSLVTATANYAHLCCVQTAAKILAATFMYLTANHLGQRHIAEQIILAGIAREQKMIRPGQGFTMYPESDHIDDSWGKQAVRYLWKLEPLTELTDLSVSLRQAANDGLEMADTAAQAYHMQRIPKQIQCLEDAYQLANVGKQNEGVSQFLQTMIDFSSSQARLKVSQHVVENRKNMAYAAACLMILGDLTNGIKLANQVTRQFNEQGRLYSTEDSVAAIALMIQLKKSDLVTGTARLRVNHQEMTAIEAAQLNETIESVEVLEGIAAVEVTRVIEEDWGQFANHFPVQIDFKKAVKAGERIEMVISLPDGYQAGDLVHVALPACLSWIQGGGKLKRFTLDFEGRNEIRIPLFVTSPIEGKQHFAVCVRNMFQEERASSPGWLTIDGISSTVGTKEDTVSILVSRILSYAIKKKASQLHFEPDEKIYRVRFCIDGVFQDIYNPPITNYRTVVARLKAMSQMDVSVHDVPQCGYIQSRSDPKRTDFYVMSLPTLWGEKIVLLKCGF